MIHYDEMIDKYGFADGSKVPEEAFECRTVYVKGINAFAALHESNYRAVAYNRPGAHNPVMIVFTTKQFAEGLTDEELVSGKVYFGDSIIERGEPDEHAMQDALEDAQGVGLDGYVVITVTIKTDELEDFLGNLV